MDILPARLTPLSPVLKKVDEWTQPDQGAFKKHVLSRVVSAVAIPALAPVSVLYDAFAFAVKTPVVALRYTVGLCPIKKNGKWQTVGGLLPDSLGFVEWTKHAVKVFAYAIDTFFGPLLGLISPRANIWVHEKLGLITPRTPKAPAENPYLSVNAYDEAVPLLVPGALDPLRSTSKLDVKSVVALDKASKATRVSSASAAQGALAPQANKESAPAVSPVLTVRPASVVSPAPTVSPAPVSNQQSTVNPPPVVAVVSPVEASGQPVAQPQPADAPVVVSQPAPQPPPPPPPPVTNKATTSSTSAASTNGRESPKRPDDIQNLLDGAMKNRRLVVKDDDDEDDDNDTGYKVLAARAAVSAVTAAQTAPQQETARSSQSAVAKEPVVTAADKEGRTGLFAQINALREGGFKFRKKKDQKEAPKPVQEKPADKKNTLQNVAEQFRNRMAVEETINPPNDENDPWRE